MQNEYRYERNDFQCFIAHEVGVHLNLHDEVELIYVYKGKVRAFYNFEEYIINENEFILIFPNIVHAFESLEKTTYLLSIFNKNNFPTMESIFSTQCIDGSPVLHKNQLHPEVEFCVKQLYERAELHQKCNTNLAYLMLILDNILKQVNLKPLKEGKDIKWIQQVLSYLNENYSNPIKLDDLSKKMGISKFHLSRNFNARIGRSISEYVNRLRVEKAKVLLENTELHITTIAMECGFDSLTTFFRVFKELGVGSPKKYREICIKNKTNKK